MTRRWPTWAGRIWNVAVILVYLLFCAASVDAVAHPTPENAKYPAWFLALEYGLLIIVGFGALCWRLLDRRRIARAFPRVDALTRTGERRGCLMLLIGSILAIAVAGTASGIF